jgi:predicted NBD/HSP70 family sugar kinase
MSVAALELGGSHVSAARVEVANGRVADPLRVPLDAHGSRAELLEGIVAAARSVADGATRVGVAVPGPFDYARGICTLRGVGKLEALFGVDLRSELSNVFPAADARAIRFLNDAEAFLLGEAAVGGARWHSRAIGITLGTGLGSAFLVDGEIVRSGPGVPAEGELHRVPFRGRAVEDMLSGRGLRMRFGGDLDAERIASLADVGDPRATAVFASFGADLAAFLAPWVREFGAQCVVVGGAIAHAWPHFGAALTEAIAVDVARAERMDDAALLGAALHAVAPPA